MSDRTGTATGQRRPGEVQTDDPTAVDLTMLVAAGGRLRSEPEDRNLLAAAGFELQRIVPTASGLRVLEAHLV